MANDPNILKSDDKVTDIFINLDKSNCESGQYLTESDGETYIWKNKEEYPLISINGTDQFIDVNLTDWRGPDLEAKLMAITYFGEPIFRDIHIHYQEVCTK